MYGCEVGCIPVPTECCCNSHSIWSVVVHHKLNISASQSIIFVHWLWNSGHGVGLTTELRPLQGDCEIAVFKVGLVTPYGYHRRVWNICTVLRFKIKIASLIVFIPLSMSMICIVFISTALDTDELFSPIQVITVSSKRLLTFSMVMVDSNGSVI